MTDCCHGQFNGSQIKRLNFDYKLNYLYAYPHHAIIIYSSLCHPCAILAPSLRHPCATISGIIHTPKKAKVAVLWSYVRDAFSSSFLGISERHYLRTRLPLNVVVVIVVVATGMPAAHSTAASVVVFIVDVFLKRVVNR